MRETQRLCRKTVLDAFCFEHCDPNTWVTLGMQSSMEHYCASHLHGNAEKPRGSQFPAAFENASKYSLGTLGIGEKKKKKALKFSRTITHCWQCQELSSKILNTRPVPAAQIMHPHSITLTQKWFWMSSYSGGFWLIQGSPHDAKSSENQVLHPGITYNVKTWE